MVNEGVQPIIMGSRWEEMLLGEAPHIFLIPRESELLDRVQCRGDAFLGEKNKVLTFLKDDLCNHSASPSSAHHGSSLDFHVRDRRLSLLARILPSCFCFSTLH
ncbi:hypothetical protein DMENIID0001_032560 [Sergentomyia squamirostris]